MKNTMRYTIVIGLILIAITTRLIPHAPNFTAIGAIALFGGAMFRDRFKAFLIPLAALLASDLILNNLIYAEYFEGFVFLPSAEMGFVYLGFILSVLIGKGLIKGFKLTRLIGAGLLSSVSFYLITNFGSWLVEPVYAKTFAGLLQSYVAGLPFFVNEIAGTFVYGTVLFGAAFAILPRTEESSVGGA